MYVTKIWLFLLSLCAVAALGVALLIPRPAQRASLAAEKQKLVTACGVANILLTDLARQQVGVAAIMATSPDVVQALGQASAADALTDAHNAAALTAGKQVIESVSDRPPDFAMLIDKNGRVVARVRVDEREFGDAANGRPLVDDALAGYIGDDVWRLNKTLYFVRAAPVVRRDAPVDYVGALVIGYAANSKLTQQLGGNLATPGVTLGFFLGSETVATADGATLDNDKLAKAEAGRTGPLAGDCAGDLVAMRTGSDTTVGLVARLPGDATQHHGYYAVLTRRPVDAGFFGALHAIVKGDLAPTHFPWAMLGGALSLFLAIGIGLTVLEADRPLRRLAVEAVRLGKGEVERLSESGHPGKFGSIARSVNIHIDKLGREAKTAKQDLDGLLGPVPDGGLGTIDLLASALPSARNTPAAPPPPSEFRFSDPAPEAAAVRPPPPALPSRAGTPRPPLPNAMPGLPAAMPAMPAMPPPRASAPAIPTAPTGPASFETSIEEELEPAGDGIDMDQEPYYRDIFSQFIALKKSCGEPIAGVTYAKFSEKLQNNRNELLSRTGCRDVRFTVYVKDGKAALKASPVRDEA